MVGQHRKVLEMSHEGVHDPFRGCSAQGADDRTIPRVRESIKELAQIDGAFVISSDGQVVSGRPDPGRQRGIDHPLERARRSALGGCRDQQGGQGDRDCGLGIDRDRPDLPGRRRGPADRAAGSGDEVARSRHRARRWIEAEG